MRGSRRPADAGPGLFRPAACLLTALVLVAGCGHKGPVRPLEHPLPAAPQNLVLHQKGARFLLAWTLPARNQDGSPLTDLQGFKVYRMEYEPGEECPECRDTSVLLQEVDLDYLRRARRAEDRILLWDTELKPETGYLYRVAAFTSQGREGASATVRRPVHAPPPPPSELQAAGLDSLVRLTWRPVEAPGPGRVLLGYNLYRHRPEEPFPATPLNRTVQEETTFEDFAVENGRAYVYAVRTVVKIGDRTVESRFSPVATATPRPGR